MTHDQQAARINVSDDEWIEFRTLGRKRLSIADYLGKLVRRELGRSEKPVKRASSENPEPARRRISGVCLADQELLTGLPKRSSESPPREI